MDAEKETRSYLVYKLTQMADAGPLGFDAETIREAARALAQQPQGWRPIETVPNTSEVVLFCDNRAAMKEQQP